MKNLLGLGSMGTNLVRALSQHKNYVGYTIDTENIKNTKYDSKLPKREAPEEYEALAIELATNPEKLKAIKDKLKSNLSSAPLFDTPLFTKNIESAYTKMYERYHEGLEHDHIYVE